MTSFLQLDIQQAHAAERSVKVDITNSNEMSMNHKILAWIMVFGIVHLKQL